MYSFLPDELLKEILAPALQVPDDAFACVGGRSPFSNYTPTTSAYLLVCKDWLRVATPLLYSVVVLRSKAQIQALESAIAGTPVLADFIKKLRIESGYCSSLLKILKGAKNLTDLCVSLEIYSSDNVSSFCRGLAFVQPRRLIIYDHRRLNKAMNQKAQDLTKALQDYIPKWENTLTNVSLPWLPRWNSQPMDAFVQAAFKNKSIQVIAVRIGGYNTPNWFKELPKELPNLKKVIVLADFQSSHVSELTRMVETDSQLKSLVEYKYNVFKIPHIKANDVSGSTLQKVPSMLDASNGIATFPDAVWNNILFYALGLPELEQHDLATFSHLKSVPEYQTQFRRQLSFVCKKFHELVIPLYYRCIIATAGQEISSLNTLLSRDSEIGKQVNIFLTYEKTHNHIQSEDINQILTSMPNLRRVSTNLAWYNFRHSGFTRSTLDSFDVQALTTLAQTAGDNLIELFIHLRRPSVPKTPEIFYPFTALKHLQMSSSAVFTYEESTVEKHAFPNLESLTCAMTSNSFLLLLSIMNLPKIQRASFPSMEKCEGAITFLRLHGQKLDFLECGFLPGICVFDVCPNLTLFEIPQEKPGFAAAEFFYSNNEHPLEMLHIKTRDVYRGAEKEKFRYLASLDLRNFTSLQKVQVDKCNWPTTENEIKKSHWVTWAERLQELYNVDIVSESGQKWVPRLRARKP